MTSIFATEAPTYWAAGLPAIPLIEKAKRPAIGRWQTYADTFPSDDERGVWLQTYPHGNIGMPMGPAANLVAIDIDTDDPKINAAIDALLPWTPWERVGAKGKVKIYRYSGERTTRIKAADGSMICEVLSKGTQIVLPPSIHPDTQRPYVANSNLYDVVKAIPALPPGIEQRIRETLTKLGIDVAASGTNKITAFVPAGTRDNAMVWHAGILARAVTRGERTLLEVLGEMEHWVDQYVEQVVGDPLSVEKAKQKVIEFLTRDVTGAAGKPLPIGWDEGLFDDDKAKLGLTFTEDHEKWSTQRIIEQLSAARETEDEDQWRQSVRVALARMVHAGNSIDALEENRVISFISGQSPGHPASALKRQLKDMRKQGPAGESHDEIARLTLDLLTPSGELRFDAGQFWQWDGAMWAQLEASSILKTIASEFGHFPAAKRNSDHNGILRTIQNKVHRPVESETRGINFANGFLNEDGELLPHSPEFGCTYILPYRYLPERAGHMPMFSQFLWDCWAGDEDFAEKVVALQEAIGATLFGRGPSYQRAILLYGAAGAGKSVLLNIVERLMPPAAVSAVPPKDWQDTFMPAQMHHKLLNIAGELKESGYIHGDIFKSVVSGEMIPAQHKNQAPFTFRPKCAQWMSSNHLPRTRDTSVGFRRRFLAFKFARPVATANKVIDLHHIILADEGEAIVAWAVEGAARLKSRGSYTLPKSHYEVLDQMANQNDSVRFFLATDPRIVVGKTKTAAKTATYDIYATYQNFRLLNGVGQVDRATFMDRLRELQDDFGFALEATHCRNVAMVGKRDK